MDVIDKVSDKGGPQVQGAVFDNDHHNVFDNVDGSPCPDDPPGGCARFQSRVTD